jgi:hypothetical protein
MRDEFLQILEIVPDRPADFRESRPLAGHSFLGQGMRAQAEKFASGGGFQKSLRRKEGHWQPLQNLRDNARERFSKRHIL